MTGCSDHRIEVFGLVEPHNSVIAVPASDNEVSVLNHMKVSRLVETNEGVTRHIEVAKVIDTRPVTLTSCPDCARPTPRMTTAVDSAREPVPINARPVSHLRQGFGRQSSRNLPFPSNFHTPPQSRFTDYPCPLAIDPNA
jgi:hypothetical protein